jgi:hypothetical protein
MKKPFNDYYEYTIAEELLPALINGDYSGLEESDIKALEAWYFYAQSNTESDLFEVIGEESFFAYCEVCDLYAECYTVRQHFYNEEATV